MTAPDQAGEEGRLDPTLLRAVEDLGATLHAALVVVGDRLGLYRALAGGGPLTPGELARLTSVDARYVREWLNAQAAGGYVAYDPDSGRYTLATGEADPVLPGLFQLAFGAVGDAAAIVEGARTGAGARLAERCGDVRAGRERFRHAVCATNLVAAWLPALDGVVDKLERGALVADVGCGSGTAAFLVARAFPASWVRGFDPDPQWIEAARGRTEAAATGSRVEFHVARAVTYSGAGYDLVTTIHSLHELGDPAGAARHIRTSLGADGTWMIVEPRAGDRVEENLHPLGRVYYGLSALVSTPAALADEVGLALGAQAGEARIREVVLGAGFASFRRVAETPFDMVFEAKP